MLYGYDMTAFSEQQQVQIHTLAKGIKANNSGLVCPFLYVEFKGDDPLWIAANQCAGGSTSCVNIAERLKTQLRDSECKLEEAGCINSAAFSIAINGSEARLHVSWKGSELDYFMQRVKTFALQEEDQYLHFRKYVRNIIDWGKDMRLDGIRSSLNTLLEEHRKRESTAAKARPPPSESSGFSPASGTKKRRTS
ncbi:hypothetical protein VTI74DRAFT_3115 [Chaetomium olivicolor]